MVYLLFSQTRYLLSCGLAGTSAGAFDNTLVLRFLLDVPEQVVEWNIEDSESNIEAERSNFCN